MMRKHRSQIGSSLIFIILLSVALTVTAITNQVVIDGDVEAAGDWDDEFCVTDQGGANDISGQSDLTQFCAASNFATIQPANTLFLRWDWDEVSYPGNNTGDACALFDTDSDGKIDRALCVTIGTSPDSAPPAIEVVNLFSCDNSFGNKCGGSTSITLTGSCALDSGAATNPWDGGLDAAVECSLPLTDLAASAGSIVLTGACSFPSSVPNSNPSDCALEGDPAARLAVNTLTGSTELLSPTAVNLSAFTVAEARNVPWFWLIFPGAIALTVLALKRARSGTHLG